jgi:hypothetical protein
MKADRFAEIIGARPVGAGRWKARCPAHADNSPSLSVAEGDDGRILLCCHAGCSAAEIVSAKGLSLADLFEGRPRPEHERDRLYRRPRADFQAMADVVDECALILELGHGDFAHGSLSQTDMEAVRRAILRLQKIARMLRHAC